MSSVNASWIYQVGRDNFDQLVIEKSRQAAVIVDFWSPNCGPCRMLTPILEKLVAEHQGDVLLAKINTDEEPDLAMQFGISAVPTVIAFRGGKPVLDFVGLLPEEQLREVFQRLSPSEADRLAQRALPLETTDFAQAEKLYRQALEQDRDHELAHLGLARLMISQNQDAKALELLEKFGPGSEHGSEVERLNALLELRKLARELPEESVLHSRVKAKPKDARALYELGCVLAVKGKYSEALESLLAAAEVNPTLASEKVRPAMVQVFQIVGPQSALANDYRNKLSTLLY